MEGDVVKAWRGPGSPRIYPGLLPARRRPASVREVANGGEQGTVGAPSGVSDGLIGSPVPPASWTEVILYVQSGRHRAGGPGLTWLGSSHLTALDAGKVATSTPS